MFSTQPYDRVQLKKYLCKTFTKTEYVEEFLDIIDTNERFTISGSSILQLITNEYYNLSDIDIYIDISNINIYDCSDFLANLISLFNLIIDKCSYIGYGRNGTVIDYTRQIIVCIKELGAYRHSQLPWTYNSLKEYIKSFIRFTNEQLKTTIEIMFINTPVSTLIQNTFDIDIVKNYYQSGNVYINNIAAIKSKIGTISYKHFTKRILQFKHEFINFLNRAIKYHNRGYTIYIGRCLLTSKLLKYITNLISIKKNYYTRTENATINDLTCNNLKKAVTNIVTIDRKYNVEKITVDTNRHIFLAILFSAKH